MFRKFSTLTIVLALMAVHEQSAKADICFRYQTTGAALSPPGLRNFPP
jgi:hypothetical protein